MTAAPRYDFSIGLPDKGLFPFEVWRRLSARALRALSKTPASYAPAQGREALREAVRGHISFARAVSCTADDVLICSGAQQAFDLLGKVLVQPGKTVVAVEDPGYPPLRRAFQAAGATVVPVPVDPQGIRVDCIPDQARIVCVTPSHQFPLSMPLSMERRLELLAFARARHAVIVEDDYDGEFRYGGRPLDALKTLDTEQVVFYVGTFSKSLFPALRLGYVVMPPWARAALVAAKQYADWHTGLLQQDTLARFIAEGHLARHVRKARRVYAERRQALLAAIQQCPETSLQPLPAEAGLHIAALFQDPALGRRVLAAAPHAGVHLVPLSWLAMEPRPDEAGVALGLGRIGAADMAPAWQALAQQMKRGA